MGIRDSGRGIAEEHLTWLFEPFFTTKPEGLGLGLTISRSIIDAHSGRIVAENDPRRRSQLPRAAAARAEASGLKSGVLPARSRPSSTLVSAFRGEASPVALFTRAGYPSSECRKCNRYGASTQQATRLKHAG
jgi:signal transduction histidine kinase